MNKYLRRLKELHTKDGFNSVAKGIIRFLIFSLLNRKQSHHLYTSLRHVKNNILYDNVAQPYKIIWVETDLIKYKENSGEFRSDKGIGYIKKGDWDKQYKNIRDNWLYRSLHDRFQKECSWEETEIVDVAENQISRKGNWWGCETIDEVINHRCKKLEELYYSISEEGYKTQNEIDQIIDRKKHSSREYVPLEILVVIGRNGKVLFRTGHHRMMIAKILDVDKIPVMVMGRHHNWQKKRDSFSGGEYTNDDLTAGVYEKPHPDLLEFQPTSQKN